MEITNPTQYLPGPLKRLGTVQAKTFAYPDSFYAKHIYPVFDANCIACHGEAKVKGHLRLDTYDRLMRGGEDGAVVIPGMPEIRNSGTSASRSRRTISTSCPPKVSPL